MINPVMGEHASTKRADAIVRGKQVKSTGNLVRRTLANTGADFYVVLGGG